jgi:hypothetical protein
MPGRNYGAPLREHLSAQGGEQELNLVAVHTAADYHLIIRAQTERLS